jgi:hypothetical protein
MQGCKCEALELPDQDALDAAYKLGGYAATYALAVELDQAQRGD